MSFTKVGEEEWGRGKSVEAEHQGGVQGELTVNKTILKEKLSVLVAIDPL